MLPFTTILSSFYATWAKKNFYKTTSDKLKEIEAWDRSKKNLWDLKYDFQDLKINMHDPINVFLPIFCIYYDAYKHNDF